MSFKTKIRFCILLALIFAAFVSVNSQSPANVERDLLAQLNLTSKDGTYGGSYDEDKVNAANNKITETLLNNCKTLACLRYAFPMLKGEMFVTTSKDGKLRIYSWDMQTGGTMHDYSSVYQYQGKSGKIYTSSAQGDDESAGSFYSQIFQVNAVSGPVYLVNSNFVASSSLNGQSIEAVRINGEKLDMKPRLIKTVSGLTNSISFGYDFFSVVDRPERPVRLFVFNEAKNEFKFPVVVEDEKTPQGRVTDKFITYRFDGTNFVKVN
ncbi:MAG TPA: hypothetical protein VK612_07955 [Pyrinomonadaceae bacterium]|nr:hypothetical protein [Pyrinomonadaceae bacterium]